MGLTSLSRADSPDRDHSEDTEESLLNGKQPSETCQFISDKNHDRPVKSDETKLRHDFDDAKLSESQNGKQDISTHDDKKKSPENESADVPERNPRDPQTEAPPDGGYGWVIVVTCLLVMTNYGSNWVMFSVYNTDFSETFDRPQAHIGIIGSVDAVFSQVTALPAGAFVSLYGCRAVCIVGLLIYGAGTFLSAFTSNFYTLVLTFGVIKGSGVGMIYIPSSMLVQQYFTKKRALAAGIASCGLSLGTMTFGPIHRLLISSYGWRGGLIISSGIIFQMVVCAALMRPLRKKKTIAAKSADNETVDVEARSGHKQLCCKRGSGKPNACVTQMSQIALHMKTALKLSVFRDPRLTLFLLIKTLSMFGILAMYKFSVARAVDFKIDKLSASFLVTSIGIASSVCRNIGGLIGSIERVNRLLMYSITTSVGGVIAILSIAAKSTFSWHVIFHVMYGIFLGLAECLLPTVITDLFTITLLPIALGWLMLMSGTVSLLCMPIFGLMFDLTGSFDISYIFGGTMQIVGGFCGMCILIYDRTRRKRERPEINTVTVPQGGEETDQQSTNENSKLNVNV